MSRAKQQPAEMAALHARSDALVSFRVAAGEGTITHKKPSSFYDIADASQSRRMNEFGRSSLVVSFSSHGTASPSPS